MATSPSAFDALLSTLRTEEGVAKAHIDEGWMQGRTAYGGVTAAIALAGALELHPTETPLRYAQISFVGPVSGDCTVNTRVLRQSKSSQFIDAGVSSDQGFGTAAVFAFSGARQSHLDHNRLAVPTAPDPVTLQSLPEHKVRPRFTNHFDMRPVNGPRFEGKSDVGEYLTWVKFVETPSCHPVVALLALGDALPPAAMALFSEFGPISSMNWTVNMLTGEPETDDGWWLLSVKTGFARGGFSAQDMMIWNRAGEPIASGSQGVAFYV